MPHCRVLPPGELNGVIPELSATQIIEYKFLDFIVNVFLISKNAIKFMKM